MICLYLIIFFCTWLDLSVSLCLYLIGIICIWLKLSVSLQRFLIVFVCLFVSVSVDIYLYLIECLEWRFSCLSLLVCRCLAVCSYERFRPFSESDFCVRSITSHRTRLAVSVWVWLDTYIDQWQLIDCDCIYVHVCRSSISISASIYSMREFVLYICLCQCVYLWKCLFEVIKL